MPSSSHQNQPSSPETQIDFSRKLTNGSSRGFCWCVMKHIKLAISTVAVMHMGDPNISGYLFHTFSVWMAQLEWSYSWRIIKLGRSTTMEPQKSQPFPYATGCAVLETMVCWQGRFSSMQPSILKLTRHLKNRESREITTWSVLTFKTRLGIKPTSSSSSSPVLTHQQVSKS